MPKASPRRPTRKSAKTATRVRSRSRRASSTEIGCGCTILYVHGIGNKPIESVLKCQWDQALFGYDLGACSRLAYWVNREYYPSPAAGQLCQR